jgi:hypothetical protein
MIDKKLVQAASLCSPAAGQRGGYAGTLLPSCWPSPNLRLVHSVSLRLVCEVSLEAQERAASKHAVDGGINLARFPLFLISESLDVAGRPQWFLQQFHVRRRYEQRQVIL